MDLQATILAVATPPGQSTRGMVRVAGPKTIELVNSIFESPLEGTGGVFPVRLGVKALRLPALAIVFTEERGPIGQPVVELWLPGHPDLLHRVLNLLLAKGATLDVRMASPGEFTARAWMLGRMNLTQAEGVGLLVSAEYATAVRAAHKLLAGGPGERLKDLREQILDLLSALEAGIDFSDQEDVRFMEVDQVQSTLASIHLSLTDFRARGVPLERFSGAPRVVVVGPPNAGKSTLCNALLSGERFLTAPVEGTTRDAVATPWSLDAPGGQIEAILVDSPGVFDNQHAVNLGSTNLSDQASHRHVEVLESAAVVLSCYPAGAVASGDSVDDHRLIRVQTKIDLVNEPTNQAFNSFSVSAQTGEGIGILKELILKHLMHADDRSVDGVALRQSHWSSIDQGLQALEAAKDLAQQDPCPDELVCEALLLARHALDEILGDRDPEAVFDRVFSSFCIGK